MSQSDFLMGTDKLGRQSPMNLLVNFAQLTAQNPLCMIYLAAVFFPNSG
ncbi:MAG: hypothetical protein RLY14_2397 [Planctomycetota bacterium]|jgi:hypothetical protein